MTRLLIATLAILALIPAAASAKTGVPSRVQVPAGHAPFLLAHAIGVHIYACSAITSPARRGRRPTAAPSRPPVSTA